MSSEKRKAGLFDPERETELDEARIKNPDAGKPDKTTYTDPGKRFDTLTEIREFVDFHPLIKDNAELVSEIITQLNELHEAISNNQMNEFIAKYKGKPIEKVAKYFSLQMSNRPDGIPQFTLDQLVKDSVRDEHQKREKEKMSVARGNLEDVKPSSEDAWFKNEPSRPTSVINLKKGDNNNLSIQKPKSRWQRALGWLGLATATTAAAIGASELNKNEQPIAQPKPTKIISKSPELQQEAQASADRFKGVLSVKPEVTSPSVAQNEMGTADKNPNINSGILIDVNELPHSVEKDGDVEERDISAPIDPTPYTLTKGDNLKIAIEKFFGMGTPASEIAYNKLNTGKVKIINQTGHPINKDNVWAGDIVTPQIDPDNKNLVALTLTKSTDNIEKSSPAHYQLAKERTDKKPTKGEAKSTKGKKKQERKERRMAQTELSQQTINEIATNVLGYDEDTDSGILSQGTQENIDALTDDEEIPTSIGNIPKNTNRPDEFGKPIRHHKLPDRSLEGSSKLPSDSIKDETFAFHEPVPKVFRRTTESHTGPSLTPEKELADAISTKDNPLYTKYPTSEKGTVVTKNITDKNDLPKTDIQKIKADQQLMEQVMGKIIDYDSGRNRIVKKITKDGKIKYEQTPMELTPEEQRIAISLLIDRAFYTAKEKSGIDLENIEQKLLARELTPDQAGQWRSKIHDTLMIANGEIKQKLGIKEKGFAPEMKLHAGFKLYNRLGKLVDAHNKIASTDTEREWFNMTPEQIAQAEANREEK